MYFGCLVWGILAVEDEVGRVWDTCLDGVVLGMRLGDTGEESEGLREYELFLFRFLVDETLEG